MSRMNNYGQPIGKDLSDWNGAQMPTAVTLIGRTCRLEPIDVAKHADDLYASYNQAANSRDWTYLLVDPFENIQDWRIHINERAHNESVFTFAVINLASDKAVGMISLMHINPAHGELEIGRVVFFPLLKQSILSTETQFLLMEYVFDTLNCRRYQWKCDSFNKPSGMAAERLNGSHFSTAYDLQRP